MGSYSSKNQLQFSKDTQICTFKFDILEIDEHEPYAEITEPWVEITVIIDTDIIDLDEWDMV